MNPQQFNFLGNNTLQNFQNNTGAVINQTSNESEKFPWLTKQQETEIMNKANQANVTESQKNYMLNDMYQQQLRRNQIDKFAEERENTKRQLIRRAVESKDIKTSKQSKQIEKKWDVADMIRKYVSATQEIDLNKLNKVPDDQIIADFTADNPDVAYAIDDFTKSQMSSQYFSEMMGFSQFEEQQDEWFFKNLLNSITYGVETWAKWLKWLIDKWLDTAEWNSNESSYSMENLTAFDNYIQHKYWVSGSQLRESDKEVWQQERNLVQDNPEVLKQYMTTASEDALNFAEWYTDALFTATNPYMALGMKTVWATEQEMWGGVLTWLAEKMGWVWEIINSIPWLSNYRDTLSPEDQQRFDAFVGNVAVGLILWTKNKKNIIKDPKTFLMENLQPNQITKNFVQSVTWMPDRLLWGTDSLAGGAKWLMSKATKWVDNAGNVLDRAAEWGAKKITWTATAQDKLYKAQEPRMNILSEKKNLERRRANSDRANELILDNGYKPTNTAERLDAHQKTLNKLWGQVMDKVNAQEWVNVDQSSMITALSDYIRSKKKLWVAWISSDIKALEAELKSLKKMQAEWNTDIPTLEAKKQVLNDLIDRKGQEASEVYKWGIKLLTQEIWKIEDSIISQIPWEFSELKRDVGALLDSYEDVFKADMKNQRKKWLWLTETYSRIEWIGDTLWGIVKLFWWDASGLVKWLWKLALGKSLAKASDVDFLIKQWFEDLANERLGGNKSQASSKTAKYQVADQTNTPEFKKRFEWSKVVDESWKPLRVYHWTHNDFTVFDRSKIWAKTNNKWIFWEWFYFTSDAKYWDYYAGKWWNDARQGWKVMETYLDIKKPFMWNEINTKGKMNTLIKKLWLQEWDLRWNNTYKNQMAPITDPQKSIKFREALQKAGYDGVWYKYGDWVQDEIVAFEPNQIKSASDNIWTFDKNNPDIRYQKYWVAWQWEKGISATEWLNIRNFKNWKTVKELANQYWIDTKIVDSISTPEWQRAYWMYWDRLITLSKDLKESTVPHELLHGVFDMVDGAKRTKILEWIQKNLKVWAEQAEEWLADNFSEYYRTGKFWTKWLAKWLVEKVKQFFYQVKSYIDWTYKNEKQIRQLFDDIIDWKIEWEYWVYSDPKFQSVWHWSPYDFDRFDSTYMGAWEWNQVHGWGHYVAVNENTSRHYAELKKWESIVNYKEQPWMILYEKLRDGSNLGLWELYRDLKYYADKWEWIDFNQIKKDTLARFEKEKEFAERGIEELNQKEIERKKVKKYLTPNDKEYRKRLISQRDRWEQGIKEIKETTEWDREIKTSSPNLYEVEIPDPIKKDTPTGNNYFEEDSFVENNAVDKIVKAVKDSWLEVWEREWNWKWIDKMVDSYNTEKWIQAKNMYHILKVVLWSDKAASKFLESLGYDGIHYFWWRDWEAYVIFNDDALQITKHHKY